MLPPMIDTQTLAEAEYVLRWQWTETGFRAFVPQVRLPIGLALTILLVGVGLAGFVIGFPGMAVNAAVVVGLVTLGGFGAWYFGQGQLAQYDLSSAKSFRLLPDLPPGWTTEANPHRLVLIEVDGDALRLGRRRLPLALVESVTFENGKLVIMHGQMWRCEVIERADKAVSRMLVPWLAHAALQARELSRRTRQGERRARQALADLRSHGTDES
ncbi:MAG: hypothetical protein AAGA48_14455 [Myxococcota bacterium]